MSGLITPKHRDVPVGLSVIGLDNGGVAPLSLRQLYSGLLMHALVARETSTLVSVEVLARQAVRAADALLGAQSQTQATSAPEQGPPATSG